MKRNFWPVTWLLVVMCLFVVQKSAFSGELTINQNAQQSKILTEVIDKTRDFSARIIQGGENNDFSISIDSDIDLVLEQAGENGKVVIRSEGSSQVLRLQQLGVANSADLTLLGSHLNAAISQSGNSNELLYSAEGFWHSATLEQSGSGNSMKLSQSGGSNSAVLTQLGSDNVMEIDQTGGMRITATQIGNGDTLTIK